MSDIKLRMDMIDILSQLSVYRKWKIYIMQMERTDVEEFDHVNNEIKNLEVQAEELRIQLRGTSDVIKQDEEEA